MLGSDVDEATPHGSPRAMPPADGGAEQITSAGQFPGLLPRPTTPGVYGLVDGPVHGMMPRVACLRDRIGSIVRSKYKRLAGGIVY